MATGVRKAKPEAKTKAKQPVKKPSARTVAKAKAVPGRLNDEGKRVGKGVPPRKGRKPGAQNKVTAEVKDMVKGALEDLGGKAWLVKQAKKHPTAFFTLVNKMVPTALTGEINLTTTLATKLEELRKRKAALQQSGEK